MQNLIIVIKNFVLFKTLLGNKSTAASNIFKNGLEQYNEKVETKDIMKIIILYNSILNIHYTFCATMHCFFSF